MFALSGFLASGRIFSWRLNQIVCGLHPFDDVALGEADMGKARPIPHIGAPRRDLKRLEGRGCWRAALSCLDGAR